MTVDRPWRKFGDGWIIFASLNPGGDQRFQKTRPAGGPRDAGNRLIMDGGLNGSAPYIGSVVLDDDGEGLVIDRFNPAHLPSEGR